MVLKRPFNDNVFISALLWKIKKVVAKGFSFLFFGMSCPQNSRRLLPGNKRQKYAFSWRMRNGSQSIWAPDNNLK